MQATIESRMQIETNALNNIHCYWSVASARIQTTIVIIMNFTLVSGKTICKCYHKLYRQQIGCIKCDIPVI